ncbi:hypothetical protein [Amycolatopsis sp. cmx-11-51]|uniref:hypothetical protein n=1 Tax=unclassified Amycolatopsis TaxID=2618356 RepID=UPI0039E23859
MTWSPVHQAVELHDPPRLRDLLDAGHDVGVTTAARHMRAAHPGRFQLDPAAP